MSQSATVTSNTAPMSTMEDTNIISTSGDTRTLPTTMIKGIASTMPEGSFLTTSATIMNEPTSSTESLGRDIDQFTTRDQITTTELESDKKSDVYILNADIKLNTVLSATSLALFLVLSVFMFVVVVAIVLLCLHKRRPEESNSAKIELTKMGELTAKETTSPAHTFNTNTSPVHNHYCSEEKVDIM